MGMESSILSIIAIGLAAYALHQNSQLRAQLDMVRRNMVPRRPEVETARDGQPLDRTEDQPLDPIPGDVQAAEIPQPSMPHDAQADPIQPRPVPRRPVAPPATAPAEPGALARLFGWMTQNWTYPAAALMLVLAGVFLVQYGVEKGLISPLMRVLMAVALGAALVGVGEGLRRKLGDESDSGWGALAVYLPSTFAGAGTVIVAAAIVAAHHLYDMIGTTPTLALLALLAFAVMALGWFYGPLMAMLGVVLGSAAPFLLRQTGAAPDMLMGYFALLAALGLGIDALRRWGWVSATAVVAPSVAAIVLFSGPIGSLPFALYLGALGGAVLLAAGVSHPVGVWRLVRPGAPWLALLAFGGVALGLVASMDTFAAPMVAAGLVIAVALHNRASLHLLAALPGAALVGWVIAEGVLRGDIYRQFSPWSRPETHMSYIPSLLVLIALVPAFAALWRSEASAGRARHYWATGGIALPVAALVALELFWDPGLIIGDYAWALHASALAAGATGLASVYARQGRGLRLGVAAAAALTLIALSVMLILSDQALTLALCVLLVAGAALDRRLDIPEIGWFLRLGALALGWRLTIDPGVTWAMRSASPLEIAAIGGAICAALALARWLILPLDANRTRRNTLIFLESSLTGLGPVVIALLVGRASSLYLSNASMMVTMGITAALLLVLARVQFDRSAMEDGFTRLRRVFGVILMVVGLALLLVSLVLGNPLTSGFFSPRVAGPVLLNTLIPGYLLPGLGLVWLARGLTDWKARFWSVAGWALVVFWGALAIRHVWQGPNLSRAGTEPGELYAYTVALIAAALIVLARALALGRDDLRKIGMGLAALASAKAFLVDASGLDGLLRVGAFLALGLVLAFLAWLNRWTSLRITQHGQDTEVR
jgi:uncharacterized membrane protein